MKSSSTPLSVYSYNRNVFYAGIPRTIRESVAKVNEAFLPTGSVEASAYSLSAETRFGSAKGSLSAVDDGAMRRL